MARPTRHLIAALHVTAERIGAGSQYQWGNMGSCNCGHLAQTLTRQSRAELHAAALMRAGDWGEQSVDYCATSGYPLDHVITTMLETGMTLADIHNLERLSDARVLARLPLERRWLARNRREDAVLYLETWAAMLREELATLEGEPAPDGFSIASLVVRLRAEDPELGAEEPGLGAVAALREDAVA